MIGEHSEPRGTLPQNWFFTTEREAATFYGDPLTALLFEAMPRTPLFESLMEAMSRQGSVIGALGRSADFLSACELTRLPLHAINDIVDDDGFLADYRRSRHVFASEHARVLCRTLKWPLAAFYRSSRVAWHSGTVCDAAAHKSFDSDNPPF